MQRTIIAVVDATRARLFTFDRSDDGGGLRETMSERTDLVNPARRLTPGQLFSDSRTSTSRAGGKIYGLDDHRDAHIDNMDAEFAGSIVAAIGQTLRDTHAKHVILCASPRMLGTLRAAELHQNGVVVDELARDYVKMTPSQIHDHLVEQRLLPASPPRLGLA